MYLGAPQWLCSKEPASNATDMGRRLGFNPCIGNTPWRRKWQLTPWEIPWTEEPGELPSLGLQKRWTKLGDQKAAT